MSKRLATTTAAPVGTAFAAHDHARCVEDALARARSACRERGARLTGLREQVLRLVWQSHRPVGAYALLDMLGTASGSRRPGPPTVYRALEFLREHGLVHRVESLNAYIGCQIGDGPHDHALYICRGCGHTLETAQPAIRDAVAACAASAGFTVESMTLEVLGRCPACAGTPR
ncbi:MAG: Zinc uptake regulation protein [Pseudomonadales bacterium]|nr:Zinc uptake regulation protein [Pseudomonadales bacterium]